MLTIRQEQINAFSQLEVEKFVDWMVVHLHKFFPTQCRTAGEKRLRGTIQTGIERAAGYRITAKRDVCKYIDLMVVLGRGFDTDRRYPWAKKILAGAGKPPQKMRDLFEAAQAYLQKHPSRRG